MRSLLTRPSWLLLNRQCRYRIGETFVHLPLPRALKRLERDNNVLSEEVSKLGDQAEQCEKDMKELKVTLYSKFGSAINLDD